MSIEVRPVENLDEFQQAFMAIGQYFGSEPTSDRMEAFAKNLPFERMHAAFEDGLIVGGAGGFPFGMSVPGGGRLPCAGTTVVGVAPTHRRRGVLRSMMRAHLDDAHERGEPLAALWASEDTIYGRFGYGAASYAGDVKVKRERVAFAQEIERRGTVRIVDVDEARRTFPALWDALARERPGVFSRSQTWWDQRVLDDPVDRRNGAGPKRFVVLELDGDPAGYAIYRHQMSWEDGSSAGKVLVTEAVATTAQANAELWRYLLDIDWVATIEAHLLPPDHPLFFLLAEPRRMGYRMGDGLWLRLLDVGTALSGRTYARGDAIVFDVVDEFCPWNAGTWRLADGEAERVDTPPDIRLDVRELGSAYMGGIGFRQLAQGGRVTELTEDALDRADGVFHHGLDTWCPEIF
jgi:predicted acetyltransferase